MSPSKRRRRKRSRLLPTLILFGLGVGCVVAAAAMWLLSPDPTAVTAARRPPFLAATAEPVVTPPTTPTPTPDDQRPPPDVSPASAEPATPAPASTATAPAEASPGIGSTAAPVTSPAAPIASPAGGRPRLAIIIDDCGQWPTTERGFVDLSFPVTLSVLPHVRYGPAIARAADAAGKGVMLHLPMQTVSGRYPGPGTITTTMDDAAIRNEVSGDLAELPEARGVNNHEGSLATSDRRVMGDVADVLVRENRFWIDSRTSSASVAASVTRDRGVPTASRDVFLDNVDNEAAVETQLRLAAERARADGVAIAIGHPRAATLLALRTLGPELMAGGIELTLASDLVH